MQNHGIPHNAFVVKNREISHSLRAVDFQGRTDEGSAQAV
jgi:hypothetical protein